MEPLKKQQIEEVPQPAKQRVGEGPRKDYDSVRRRIKTGDVFLYQGRTFFKPVVGWIAKITGWFTESRYTHAGMAVWWGERLMVIESIGRGVIVDPCSMSFSRHKSDVDWYTYKDGLSDETRNALVIHAQEQLGKRFAFWKAFLALVRTKLKLFPKRLDKYEEEKRFYCSHFVASVYNNVGHDLKKNHADPDMTPRDLSESPKLDRMGCIFRSPESGRWYDATQPRHSEIREKEDAA